MFRSEIKHIRTVQYTTPAATSFASQSREKMWSVSVPAALIAVSLLAGTLLVLYTMPAKSKNVTSTPTAEVPNSEKYDNEIWFGDLGYFSMDKPWRTLLRPVPPPMAPEDNPVIVYLYSWRNKTKSYSVTLYPEVHMGGAPFDGRRPTAIIIHGFKANTTDIWLGRLKDAYLRTVQGNVLLTDWGPGSACELLQATSNTRIIARLIVRFLNHLMEKRALRLDMIHLIGHSLGAHVASYVAKEIPGIPRLTALDPAQPAFEGFAKEVRLDKSDADFVEVVHTNAKPFIPHLGFGMIKPHGHVDFYFNDGRDQPGCTIPNEIPPIHSIADAAKFPITYDIYTFICSHTRSHDYLIEAYNKTNDCTFWGHRADTTHKPGVYTNFDSNSCNKDNCIPFGLETIKSPLRGVFVVITNSHPPFCMLESGPTEGPDYSRR